ncbi:MAG: erythromycin biosynthesis sensory transduction protein eryC1, partial [Elusimicrobia bacterium]
FIATATAALELGARPVLVDVSDDGLTLDPADLERRLPAGVKAVIPVHLYGRSADMDPILELTNARGLKVVEDCAQSHLARYKGRSVGTLGDFGAFSFYPSKNLGALGDAGALTVGDDALADLAASLRNCGRKAGAQYDHPRPGHNYRLDELQAAFLRVKLKRLAAFTAARRKVAALYREGLKDLPLTLPAPDRKGDQQVYHVFCVRSERRDALKAHLGQDRGLLPGASAPDRRAQDARPPRGGLPARGVSLPRSPGPAHVPRDDRRRDRPRRRRRQVLLQVIG